MDAAPATSRSTTAFDAEYIVMRSSRARWFSAINHSGLPITTLFGEGGEVDAGQHQPRLKTKAGERGTLQPFTSRQLDPLVNEIKKVREASVMSESYFHDVWVPVNIDGVHGMHANALHVRVYARLCEFTAFEPHGSNLFDAGQATFVGVYKLYTPAAYAQLFTEAMHYVKERLGLHCEYWRLRLPASYGMPPTWGQSTSDVLGKQRGDGWCVLWTTVFLVYTSCVGPTEGLISAITELRERGELAAWLKGILQRRSSWQWVAPSAAILGLPPRKSSVTGLESMMGRLQLR